MDRLNIGVVSLGAGEELDLAAAAERDVNLDVQPIQPDAAPVDGIDGLIVSVPVAQRGEIMAQLASRWHVPILIEAPFAATLDEASAIQPRLGQAPIFSLNPLRSHVPTKRLHDDIVGSGDPLQTVFALWRFQPGIDWRQAPPQMIDFVGSLAGEAPERVSAMKRENPTVVLGLMRYPSGVVANLEMGDHLPATLPYRTELLLECFCRESVYHCEPDNQAITVQGATRVRRDWSPDPADGMVEAFVRSIRAGDAPARGVADDIAALTIWQSMLDATQETFAPVAGSAGKDAS